MNEFLSMILSNLIPILGTCIAAILGYVGMCLKNLVENMMKQKAKEKIVTSTVYYVEQISKNANLSSAEKFVEAKEKASSWLREKNLKFSDTELDILIECAVKNLE